FHTVEYHAVVKESNIISQQAATARLERKVALGASSKKLPFRTLSSAGVQRELRILHPGKMLLHLLAQLRQVRDTLG
ncbi:hypothetical protein, partial [Pseudomonas aeruginosa]|uniref:hypothetical protein n=1 Tax=Pseudomonas aeruginosa TaxID=287 RepID=UPI00397AB701